MITKMISVALLIDIGLGLAVSERKQWRNSLCLYWFQFNDAVAFLLYPDLTLGLHNITEVLRGTNAERVTSG